MRGRAWESGAQNERVSLAGRTNMAIIWAEALHLGREEGRGEQSDDASRSSRVLLHLRKLTAKERERARGKGGSPSASCSAGGIEATAVMEVTERRTYDELNH